MGFAVERGLDEVHIVGRVIGEADVFAPAAVVEVLEDPAVGGIDFELVGFAVLSLYQTGFDF